ncbi:MAG: outer membrane protein assembly factor BamD [Phycisphaeraceae bacterium]|nr:outer membrane protein assembly factor BamD [Phycisphaeraceae bacterium]
MPRWPLIAACFSAASLLCGSAALAQSTELRLDASGTWEQTDAPIPGTPEAVLAEARRALANDRPGAAKLALDPWIKANERAGSPLLAEAILLRGDAYTALGDEYEALYDYERVIREFPATESYTLAVERELNIGVKYVNGMRRRFFGVRILDAEDIGEELLIRVQERLPGSRVAERAGIELADHYFRARKLELASDAYDLFVQLYPRSQYVPKAMERRIYATIAAYKGPRYDPAPLLDAQVLVRRFAAFYPAQAQQAGLDDALVARLDDSAAQELIESARWYLSRNDEVSARYILKRLLRAHPRSGAAQTAYSFMVEKGWIEPPQDEPSDAPQSRPADTAGESAANLKAPEARGIRGTPLRRAGADSTALTQPESPR